MNHFPLEIVKLICSFADIDSIEKLNINLDKNFWNEYFHSHKVKIITERDSLKQWVHEFKINIIVKLLNSLPEPIDHLKIITAVDVTTLLFEYPRHSSVAKSNITNNIIFIQPSSSSDRVHINNRGITCYLIEKGRIYQILFKLFSEGNFVSCNKTTCYEFF